MSEAEPCTLLPWDTEFWGVGIGRVEGDAMTPERAAAVIEWARASDVDCLYFLAGEDPASAQASEDAGFRLMDVRVGLARPTGGGRTGPPIRPFRETDLSALRTIARTSHRVTRFYSDPRFPAERCDDLYETWITRSVHGWADAVLVAERDGEAAGYISCHVDMERARGSIGLFAVAEHARGNGLGALLVDAAVAWCGERGLAEIGVVTQGRSAAAFRAYERAGFAVESLGFWFHGWFDR